MRRAALVAAALWSGAAAAYIPSVTSLLKRAATHKDDVDRSRDVTLKGLLQVGGNAPIAASLTLSFPLRCRLQTDAATGKGESPGAVSVRGAPGNPRIDDEGTRLGAARDLLAIACPLLTFKGDAKTEGEKTLREVAASIGAELTPTALGRLGGRTVYVLGSTPQRLEVPQLWFYKDEMAPARLLSKATDLRLLEYGSPASALAFPRVIELWREGRLAARFEALEAGGRRAAGASEDDDRD